MLKYFLFGFLLTISAFSQIRVANDSLVFTSESEKLTQATGWYKHTNNKWYEHENYIGGPDASNVNLLSESNFSSIQFKKATLNKEKFYVLIVERNAIGMRKKQGIEAAFSDDKYNVYDETYIDYYFLKKNDFKKIQEFAATPINISFFARTQGNDTKEDIYKQIFKRYNEKKKITYIMRTKLKGDKVQFLLPVTERERNKFNFPNCYYETSIKKFSLLFHFSKTEEE